MRRTLVIAFLAAVAGLGARNAPAAAHGPCRCLDPVLTQAGNAVRIGPEGMQAGARGHPAYRVLFNPRPSDFGIAPHYLASAYRADAPTTTVLSRSRREPTRKGRFRVPTDTPAGLYMVLIWDGEEGGGHNTWDYLHVTDWDEPAGPGVTGPQETSTERSQRNSATRNESRESSSSPPWPLVAGVGFGGLVLGFAGSRAAGRRRA
jgi:hypothetical protein